MWILLLRESGMSFYPRCYRLPEDLLALDSLKEGKGMRKEKEKIEWLSWLLNEPPYRENFKSVKLENKSLVNKFR